MITGRPRGIDLTSKRNIAITYRAVVDGSWMTWEITAITGIPIKHVSAYLCTLERYGFVRGISDKGRRKRWSIATRP